MRRVRLDRRALLGAVLGATTALLGEVIAGVRGDIAFTSILVVAVTVSGLLLGARAATWAYVAAAIVSLVALLDPSDRLALEPIDVVRFGSFLIGSLIILVLVRRAEMDRLAAAEALRLSRAAEGRLESIDGSAPSELGDLCDETVDEALDIGVEISHVSILDAE